jgi:hypothetical protein
MRKIDPMPRRMHDELAEICTTELFLSGGIDADPEL